MMDFFAKDILGTPFMHRGRDPGVGLDCLGLMLELFRIQGIPIETPSVDYDRGFAESSDLFHLHWPDDFHEIQQATQSLDVVQIHGHGMSVPQHLVTLVMPGWVMDINERDGAHMRPLAVYRKNVSRIYRHWEAQPCK